MMPTTHSIGNDGNMDFILLVIGIGIVLSVFWARSCMAGFTLADLAPYFESTFQAELLQDWKQTRDMQRPEYWQRGRYETNPILGKHPSQSAINTYMPLVGLAHYAGYAALPDNYKLPYSLVSSIVEEKPVVGNEKIERRGYSIPLLGLGGLISYYILHDWNEKHKDSKLAPYSSATDSGTPIAGLSLHY
jgi:hypothetical protein